MKYKSHRTKGKKIGPNSNIKLKTNSCEIEIVIEFVQMEI